MDVRSNHPLPAHPGIRRSTPIVGNTDRLALNTSKGGHEERKRLENSLEPRQTRQGSRISGLGGYTRGCASAPPRTPRTREGTKGTKASTNTSLRRIEPPPTEARGLLPAKAHHDNFTTVSVPLEGGETLKRGSTLDVDDHPRAGTPATIKAQPRSSLPYREQRPGLCNPSTPVMMTLLCKMRDSLRHATAHAADKTPARVHPTLRKQKIVKVQPSKQYAVTTNRQVDSTSTMPSAGVGRRDSRLHSARHGQHASAMEHGLDKKIAMCNCKDKEYNVGVLQGDGLTDDISDGDRPPSGLLHIPIMASIILPQHHTSHRAWRRARSTKSGLRAMEGPQQLPDQNSRLRQPPRTEMSLSKSRAEPSGAEKRLTSLNEPSLKPHTARAAGALPFPPLRPPLRFRHRPAMATAAAAATAASTSLRPPSASQRRIAVKCFTLSIPIFPPSRTRIYYSSSQSLPRRWFWGIPERSAGWSALHMERRRRFSSCGLVFDWGPGRCDQLQVPMDAWSPSSSAQEPRYAVIFDHELSTPRQVLKRVLANMAAWTPRYKKHLQQWDEWHTFISSSA
ncbi:hypothetical protein HU200_033866 [Digitaria exilis]|uniref:Uncharacterized protein n=1 Tax=Digitaria exilis TaxID=1010633 RepID=A0A835BKH6_9POAL|nr:hypothetical protein HU200_033866 [Digitaria exilis]